MQDATVLGTCTLHLRATYNPGALWEKALNSVRKNPLHNNTLRNASKRHMGYIHERKYCLHHVLLCLVLNNKC